MVICVTLSSKRFAFSNSRPASGPDKPDAGNTPMRSISNEPLDLGENKMSNEAYRNSIAIIAANEADGEDVTRDIAYLASRARVSVDMIRHEVTAMAADLD